MATLTIRNLPEDVRDQLRHEAAEHRRSMEEEARQALAERYRKHLSPQDILRRLDRLGSKESSRTRARISASDLLIASRRLEAACDQGRISREEKGSWDERLTRGKVSLLDVEQFIGGKRSWRTGKS